MSLASGILNEKVALGEGCETDDRVVIGYPSDRMIQFERLLIGKNARIRSGSVIYCGSRIGDNLQTGHNVVIREENLIGDNFRIWNNSVVDYGCVIGNNVKIHCSVYIAQYTVIEDDVFIAPGVVVANDIHPGCSYSARCMKGPIIKKGAQIGVNVTLLPFITIGEHSLVGGGSVVTKDVPPRSVVYGNPARVVKNIDNLRCITGLTDKPYGGYPIRGGLSSRR
ncbi:2,3,4,5-tetrahydropyridine-2,6-dicarboxylate N-acetyltransferase [subsurface metagenome]